MIPLFAVHDGTQTLHSIDSADTPAGSRLFQAATDQVLAGSFDDPGVVQTTFADQIPSDQVAFSVTISEARAVNGFVSPGDFVDIIVLGDPPVQAGEGDVFETSLQASPFQRPARSLFRGARVEFINNEVVGAVAAEGQLPPDEEQAANLEIGFVVPSSAAQRILSVDPADIVLTLLPPDWEIEQQANEVVEAIIVNEDLPGENPQIITPYGADGFVDALADAAAGSDTSTEPADNGVEETNLFPETDPVEEVPEVEEVEEDLFPEGEADENADDADDEEGQ